MRVVDTIIEARWVIPIEPKNAVLEHHGVAIENGRIVGLAASADLNKHFDARQKVHLEDHVLTPGFVNAHCHSAMSLMRGVADDLPLEPWLKERIWPLERRWMSPEFVADGARLAMAEMLRGGTTCVQDMYFFPDVVARTAAEIGMRAGVGAVIIDFPSAWANNAKEYIQKALELRDEYKGHPLIRVMFAPHATYTVSPQILSQLGVLSDQLEMGVHIHLHETAQEVDDVMRVHGKRPLALLQEQGLLSPLLTAIHMTQVEPDEIALLAQMDCRVVHCPESNLKIASGFCPVQDLIDAGITVGLGTDGAASNNNLSMLGEMQTAALLAKGVAQDATALNAHQTLFMSTLGSARAMGCDHEIGSVKLGKWADLTAITLDDLDVQPVFDPASQVVYAAGDHHVTDVWVGGRRQVENGKLIALDSKALIRNAKNWQTRFSAN